MAFQVEGTVYVQRLRGTKGPGMSRWKVECSVWLHYTLRVQGVQKLAWKNALSTCCVSKLSLCPLGTR